MRLRKGQLWFEYRSWPAGRGAEWSCWTRRERTSIKLKELCVCDFKRRGQAVGRWWLPKVGVFPRWVAALCLGEGSPGEVTKKAIFKPVRIVQKSQ